MMRRMSGKVPVCFVLLSLALGCLAAGPAAAAAPAGTERQTEDRLAELEAQVRRLRAELEALRQAGGGDPERQAALERQVEELARQLAVLTRELERRHLGAAYRGAEESAHGLGPAASKVYGLDQGVSIGGYGEMLYTNQAGRDDTLDLLRAVFYFGYKFNDRILFNSEIEFEHAVTGDDEEGEVAVEFAYLDFLWREGINARAGLLLLPVGFLNELHEPPIFVGATRPLVERVILPSTWSEAGAGIFGELAAVSYRAYVLNGLDSTGFSAADGIRGGRQGGAEAKANDLALAARADWTVRPGLLLGVSGYVGGSGQDSEALGETLDGRVRLYDLHAEWRWRGLRVRGLWSEIRIDDAAAINAQNGLTGAASIGERLVGWYGEAAFDVLAARATDRQLMPYVRYERLNTQEEVPAGFLSDPALDRRLLTLGVAYQPIPQVILKVDVRDASNRAGRAADEFHVALGYLF